MKGAPAYGLTYTLLTTSEGKKMGKTESGAIWLDPEKTSPYDFYQYWRNVDDRDVEKCLALLTFLPMEEVRRLGALQGSEINKAKEVLAFEITRTVHGEEEAEKAQAAARALFSSGSDLQSAPTTEIPKAEIQNGINILDLLIKVGLTASRGEGRRLVQQGGLYIKEDRVDNIDLVVTGQDFSDGALMLRKGKKVYHLVKLI